jgi:hypothetical protein
MLMAMFAPLVYKAAAGVIVHCVAVPPIVQEPLGDPDFRRTNVNVIPVPGALLIVTTTLAIEPLTLVVF